ncbi:hypothetical protein LIA77_11197 [Sarocladium implicatum]|nr:hypothetical protein LIA77_11197 [Sarocladium implicatum]
MESPPKRITRARAAAKATEPTVKTTRIVTAAARAKTAAPSTSTKSTAIKRKTRADELDDHDADELEEGNGLAKRPRGRPRKITVTEDEASVTVPKTTGRGRPAKELDAGASKAEPSKATRGRPRKNTEPNAKGLASEGEPKTTDPEKATARGRSVTTRTVARSNKPTVKKAVKFQEPDKENDGPTTVKGSSTGGMRARPTRKAASASVRTTKATTKSAASALPKPLSPKKVTQLPVARMDSSEDELAGGDTPLKRMQKQPLKPPSDLPVSPRKPQIASAPQDAEDNTLVVNNAILNPPDLGATSLGSPARRPPVSPFKDTLKSPARKIGANQLFGSTMKSTSAMGQRDVASPSKSLLQSTAKRPPSPVKGLLFGSSSHNQAPTSPLKASVLQSPAKRAMPGFKLRQPSPEKAHEAVPEDTPGMKTIMFTPAASGSRKPSEKLLENPTCPLEEEDEEDVFSGPVASLKFPGRLSAVLPRDIDPIEPEEDEPMIETEQLIAVETAEHAVKDEITVGDVLPEAEEDPEFEVEAPSCDKDSASADVQSTSTVVNNVEDATPVAKPTPANPKFQLRTKDLNPCHDMNWESEDDLSPTKGVDSTMSPFTRSPSKSRRVTMGLSSLADQHGAWAPASPISQKGEPEAPVVERNSAETSVSRDEPTAAVTPNSCDFFDQEISARIGLASSDSPLANTAYNQDMCEPVWEDVAITNEDVGLAQEADEMSLADPELLEDEVHERSFSDEVSEASQEYADENQLPVDPAIAGSTPLAPVTPARPAPKIFNTTTKVPLKPADYSTPSPIKKRSFSASRVAPRRPSGPTRNATVISYQPTRNEKTTAPSDSMKGATPDTPAKSDLWSSMGTPARTPRKDINAALLKGAVVFVDVHTSEGADASGIFIDLLSQMGARCVKSWNWSPNGEGSAAKCGITHVVFKDGGKRTMERVRQAKGVVHCVGVTWVLDCERENQWLEEGPYYIDRSFVPRGGARRRKSMEPKTLANMNGTLVNSDNDKTVSASDSQSTPKTPSNRRQSSLWMHTPSDQGEDSIDDDDYEWSKFLTLTPVPKTPAPETVARYAADLTSTPGADSEYSSPTEEDILMRTCPPKSGKFKNLGDDLLGTCPPKKSSTYEDIGVGILVRNKDEHVRMRLMAAKRKSLQFAPKIGSPLARTWQ